MNKHVAEVRQQFLRVLKQEDNSAPVQNQPQTEIEPEIDTDDESSTEKWDNVVLSKWD